MTEITNPKILIVEDNVNTQQLYRDAFRAQGFQVLVTAGAEGNFSEAVSTFNPDIISMDLMIGEPKWGEEDRDGFDAMELLKQNHESKDIPVIVMTNFFEETKVERAKELGAVDYINLQSRPITEIPKVFLNYLNNTEVYIPVHPSFRAVDKTASPDA